VSGYLVLPAAIADIEDIYVYIALDSPDTAARFPAACDETFRWLAQSPRAGRIFRGKQTRGVRVWPVAGFPNHLIFYRVRSGMIVVLHVLAGMRDLDRHVR
jgi:toxin ParE1/3/4